MSEEVRPVAWRKQVWVADGIGTGWMLSNEKPEPNHQPTEIEPLYTHPTPDKLALAVEALEKISDIVDCDDGGDWDEIREARRIARRALAAIKAAD